MTITKTHTKAPLLPGQQLSLTVGGVTIVLTRSAAANDPAFNVTTWAGAIREAGWCATFADEATARAEARRAAKLFHLHHSAAGIERHRDNLAATLTYWENRRSHTPAVKARINALLDELDVLRSFGDMARAAQLDAHLTNRYAA